MLLTHTLSPANQALDYEYVHQIKLPDQAKKLDVKFCGSDVQASSHFLVHTSSELIKLDSLSYLSPHQQGN